MTTHSHKTLLHVRQLEERMAGRTIEQYIIDTVSSYIGWWIAASVPPSLYGMVAATPFNTEKEAKEFASELVNESWVVSPGGAITAHYNSNEKDTDL
jgi:hypothetical protein